MEEGQQKMMKWTERGREKFRPLKSFSYLLSLPFFPFPFHLLSYPLMFLFLFVHKGPCAICLRNSFKVSAVLSLKDRKVCVCGRGR